MSFLISITFACKFSFLAGQTAPLHQTQVVQKEEIIEMDEQSREVIIGSM